MFTPGGASDFTARVFWEKLSFPHLDGGRAQLLLLSLPSPYSHGCHVWGRCRRVLRGREPSDFFPSAVLASPDSGVTGMRFKDWESHCKLFSSRAVFAGDELQVETVCRGPKFISHSVGWYLPSLHPELCKQASSGPLDFIPSLPLRCFPGVHACGLDTYSQKVSTEVSILSVLRTQ